MIRKVLIANRGEIAVRIMQTLQPMGIGTVAVYSDADRDAPHVALAAEAFHLEGVSAADTYLRVDRLLEAARRFGADAVHPGYGFLSENAAFARACRDAGLTFIGPAPEVIELLGDKVRSKEIMRAAGVPVVPSLPSDAVNFDTLGYPLLVKAAAGGGGKGMRRVDDPRHLADALAAASREAEKAFGNGQVFVEKYIEHPRHIEFQIFGDDQGRVIDLHERECSIQRRHQKVVEETPSPALTPGLRARMAEAAVKAGQAVRYTNAGTVEFIVDADGSFYFLEVNTRLQVEHPITEWVLAEDLVRAQIRVAQGEPLPFDNPTPRGHALECRIYAEEPARSFLPSTGTVQCYRPPQAPWVRVDTGIEKGSDIGVHYDPMIAKLSVWGPDRSVALERMRWALDQYVVLGVSHNIPFLRRLMDEPDFIAGRLHTQFIDTHPDLLKTPPGPDDDTLLVAALAFSTGGAARAVEVPSAGGPFEWAGGWRNT
ncbi:MAG TPA: biotin carboxylase N-terminal domain-containing protein [Candidatus Xenobia bacterium]